MKKRSRAYDAGSIEADSRKAKRFWAFDDQPGRPGATRAAKSSQPGRARAPKAARLSQPGRPGVTRADKSRPPRRPVQPDRANRGQIEPARASQALRAGRSSQPGQARAIRATRSRLPSTIQARSSARFSAARKPGTA